MTFSYAPSTDVGKVRFYTGDTVEDGAWFTDEEIDALITSEGTWQKAVIACIQNQLARMSSDPDVQADWLRYSTQGAIKAKQAYLLEMRRKLGVASVTATATHVYRPDSRQSSAPTFSEVQGEGNDDDGVIVVVYE